jgi:hypothetical protein
MTYVMLFQSITLALEVRHGWHCPSPRWQQRTETFCVHPREPAHLHEQVPFLRKRLLDQRQRSDDRRASDYDHLPSLWRQRGVPHRLTELSGLKTLPQYRIVGGSFINMEETSHHLHWQKKEPETLSELEDYLRSHFNYHFTKPETRAEIKDVLEWMKSNSPRVLDFDGASSFSTLFISFHTGAPFMKRMLEQHLFPQRLLDFLHTATALESATDQFAYVDNMDKLENKEKIIENLQRFLDELPTSDEFAKLVGEIR